MSALKICPTCGTEYPANERFCPRDGTALRLQEGGADLVGSIIAERYHVIRKLGEGGMGQVYLAEHVKMGRRSAVKVMNPGMVNDADAIARFNREAANASRINHPHVAGIYDFGETADGLIFLAMEYVEGESLTSVVEANGALPVMRAADIALQSAEALSVAHDMGIVHRDLKPDNIMIAKNRDGSDCVKVVDFGIAKAGDSASQKVTRTGLVVGTPEYMSPEQLAGDKLDGRSDIYSLGLVAFHMLTGKLPFPGETAQESMIMRLTDNPKRLGEMRAVAWPEEVEEVMRKVLQKDAPNRYQHAVDFGRALYAAIERMPSDAVSTDGTMQMVTPALGVPVTRFDAAAAARGGGPTAPMSIPVVSAQKRRTALYVGSGAAVVTAVVAAVLVSQSHGAAPAPAPAADSARVSGAGALPQTSYVKNPAGGPRMTSARLGAAPPSSSPSPSPGGGGGSAAPVSPSPAAEGSARAGSAPSVASRIPVLRDQATEDATTAQALKEAESLMARATPQEQVELEVVRAQAYGFQGNTAQACPIARRIKPKVDGTRDQRAIDLILGTC